MRKLILNTLMCGALGLSGLTGCTADVHDNTMDVHDNNANIDDAKVDMQLSSDSNADDVEAGTAVHVNIKAQDVFLIDPSETPPSDSVKVAGHFEIFLDSTSSTALLVTAEESVDVMIPPSTPAGDHKLVCRVDKHDGTATKATSEIDIKVKASASATGSVSGSASGSASASASGS